MELTRMQKILLYIYGADGDADCDKENRERLLEAFSNGVNITHIEVYGNEKGDDDTLMFETDPAEVPIFAEEE